MEQAPEKYSLGTAPIFKKLFEMIQQRDCPIDVIFVNAETLMRNSASRESVNEAIAEDKNRGVKTSKPVMILVKEAFTEINEFCSDIIQLMNSNLQLLNPTLILYLPDYTRCIPPELIRPVTASKQLLEECKIRLQNQFVKQYTISTVKNTKFIQMPIVSNFPPYRQLVSELAKVRNKHNVLMITHHPLDYHVSNTSGSFKLMNSFTADILEPKEFGSKVFKTEHIPFTPETHAVLGDSVDFKGSLKISEKRTLLEISEKEQWKLKTKDYIRDRLRSMSIKIPFNI